MAGPEPASILLAEHEPEVAEMSARFLRRDGLRVRLVTSPERVLAELTGGPDAAAVVDLTMPGLDVRRIRRALRTPVIFLVADLKAPRPRGLAGGARPATTGPATTGPATTGPATTWLARPFSPRRLVAMVRDLLAEDPHGHPAASLTRVAAGLRLDGTSRTLVAGGHRVPLTATECAVLAALMDNPGRVLSRRQLLAAADRPGAGDRAADVYIAQLRAKIGPVSAIRTVRGAGYVLDR